jgi:xylulokinase
MKEELLLGYDIGSSSIKASLISVDTGKLVSTASSPGREMKIDSPHPGWAEQNPELWWKHLVLATRKAMSKVSRKLREIAAIGISYQMHGLVMVDRNQRVIYPSIIWCDSRAVETGEKAFAALGKEFCFRRYLNSPGNFTASKLKWVKENLPKVYERVQKIMLPGDYVSMRLTGEIQTTISGLSEGILWDFEKMGLANDLLQHYGLQKGLIPEIVPTFGVQGRVTPVAAKELGVAAGVPVCYRAGDQPNNAFSLSVLKPGEVAATAGTSGVIYGVTDKKVYDKEGRVNTFAHVTYSADKPVNGVLLCINGTGIQYSWMRENLLQDKYSYEEMNTLAEGVEIGSEGLMCYPFGNGAERVLKNQKVDCHFSGIDFNRHGTQHLVRAALDGIAFSFRYGVDIMKQMGMKFGVIRVGDSNLFQSRAFREAFVNTCDTSLEIFETDGSQGAARGAGIGIGSYFSAEEAFVGLRKGVTLDSNKEKAKKCESAYQEWKIGLARIL